MERTELGLKTSYIDDLDVFPFSFERKVMYKDDDCEFMAELSEVAFIHLDYTKMTKSNYKRFPLIWKEIEEELEDMGYPCVFCLIPSELPMADRVEKMFGFKFLEEQPPLKLFVKDLGDK